MAETSLPFSSYLQKVSIDKHIKFQRKGSEENLKVKIIVPLLEALGWDLLDDMDFERSSMDITVLYNGTPSLVVETKSWGTIIERTILNQCFEYAIKSKVKWAFLTNGQYSALYYSPHLNPKDSSKSRPIFEFNYTQLLKDRQIFEDLFKYIGKDSFTNGNIELKKKIAADHAGSGNNHIPDIDFEELSRTITPKVMVKAITDSQIRLKLEKHNPFVRDSINRLWQGFLSFVDKNPGILNIEYGTEEVTLKVSPLLPGRRDVSLIRINFGQGKTWLYKPGWYQLNCGNIHSLLKEITQQPSHRNWTKEILELLERGIVEIMKEIEKIKT